MSKFVFNMQSLLKIKTQLEDILKDELGRAVQECEAEKHKLKHIEQERESHISDLNTQSSQGIKVKKLRELSSYISVLKNKMDLQKENVNFAQNNVDRYREQLIKAVQEKKMLEKLKEKKYQQFLKEQLREEQALIDEVVSFNYSVVKV